MNNEPRDDARRTFMKRLLGAAGGLVLASGVLPASGCEEVTLKTPTGPVPSTGLSIDNGVLRIDTAADGLSALTGINGYLLVSGLAGLPEKILVIRTSATEASALSEICTHQGCSVSPGSTGVLGSDRLVCPCHGSTFMASNGSVVKGPAASGLKSYPASVSGAIISVVLA